MSDQEPQNLDENSPNIEGISVLMTLLNSGESDIIMDFNNPDDNTCKAFALFMAMAENGSVYKMILNKLKDIIKEEPEQKPIIQKCFEYKKGMDLNIDQPAVMPRDVFRRGG